MKDFANGKSAEEPDNHSGRHRRAEKKPDRAAFSSCPDAVAAGVAQTLPLWVPREVRIAGALAGRCAEIYRGELASVYLEAIGESLIQVVVAVRNFTGLSLSETKSLTESAPTIVLSNAPRDEAERFIRELRRAGATASLR